MTACRKTCGAWSGGVCEGCGSQPPPGRAKAEVQSIRLAPSIVGSSVGRRRPGECCARPSRAMPHRDETLYEGRRWSIRVRAQAGCFKRVGAWRRDESSGSIQFASRVTISYPSSTVRFTKHLNGNGNPRRCGGVALRFRWSEVQEAATSRTVGGSATPSGQGSVCGRTRSRFRSANPDRR